MTNWFVDKDEIKNKTINAIMGELGYLTDRRRKSQTANYWIDNVHDELRKEIAVIVDTYYCDWR